jgi:1-deoxy-D-xylulose-5-phosphate reductoisomerase
MNAANEVAVLAFLQSDIAFPEIAVIVDTVVKAHQVKEQPSLQDILDADAWARKEARKLTGGGA